MTTNGFCAVYDAGGDLVVVSSDGKRFKIDKETVTSASDILDERIEGVTEFCFSDPRLEHSTYILLMLDLLHDKLQPPFPVTTLWHISTLVPLLQKYELDTPLLKLKKMLKKASSDSTPGKIFVFIAAAQLSSKDICAACIRTGGNETWKDVLRDMEDETEEEVGIERDMRASSTFDIKSWSEKISTRVPGKLMSALWKAEIGMVPDDEEDVLGVEWDVIGDRFREG